MTKARHCHLDLPEEDSAEFHVCPSGNDICTGGEDTETFSAERRNRDAWIFQASAIIGICIDTHHAVLKGRCLIRWEDLSGNPHQKWLPCIQGLAPQKHDRVIVQQPGNWFEPLICGIVDGISPPEEHEPRPGPSVTLAKHESFHLLDSQGAPLLQIDQGEQGPVLRLLNDDLDIDVKGRLRFSARDIQLTARSGGVKVRAADDVEIKGEIIYLN